MYTRANHLLTGFIAAVVITIGSVGRASAVAVVPTGFLDQLVAGPLTQPVGVAFVPDGRIFVVEQKSGAIKLIARRAAGDSLSAAILTVPDVNFTGLERGLLGVAVDPSWPARPYVYVVFNAIGNKIFVRMYTASGDLTDRTSLNVTLGSPFTILNDCPDASPDNNGGTLRFGPDGKLYVSLGDDTVTCEPQLLQNMQGCILRLDVSALPQPGSGPPPKSLITPADNPFAANPDPEAKLIAHYGLRNPFRFTVDSTTGTLYIGDVGVFTWEEVDEAATLGMNFGWPKREGAHAFSGGSTCTGTNGTDPIFEFNHGVALNVAVIGGPRYRAASGIPFFQFPADYLGDAFFLDYYAGRLRRIRQSSPGVWAIAPAAPGQPNPNDWSTGMANTSDVIEGPDGGLYYVIQFPTGQVRRVIYTGATSVSEGGRTTPADLALAVSPNPGRPAGTSAIDYQLPVASPVEIGVFDVAGNRVATVYHGMRDAGSYQVSWNGIEESGREAAPGVYFVRLETAQGTLSRKLAIVR